MANEYTVNAADLTTVADAIRAKAGTSEGLSFPDGFAAAIAGISTGAQVASGSVTTTRKSVMRIYPGFVVKKLSINPIAEGQKTVTITYDFENNICIGINGDRIFTPQITSTISETKVSNGTGIYFEGNYYWIATSE